MSKLVAFCGEAGVGKTTAAEYLVDRGYRHTKFSAKMKEGLALMLGLGHAHVEGHLKDVMIEKYGKSPRQMLQTLGTEWGQEMVHPDIWLHSVEQQWARCIAANENMVISDLRFEKQATWIRNQGGLIIHIAPGSNNIVDEAKNHASEEAISVHQSDFVVVNNKSAGKDFLYNAVELGMSNDAIVEIPCAEGQQTIQELITGWADSVFPDRTITNALSKLVMEEIPEYLTSQHDPMELADCAILIYDIAYLADIDLEAAIREKMSININRKWEWDSKTGLMNHVKTEEHEPAGKTVKYGKKCLAIPLTRHEIQSGLDRLRLAELLIDQLPEDHEGRNIWLMNYGEKNDT